MKASLSEIFAAMRGITCAGVAVTKRGADTKTNPIAKLGCESAGLQYDILCNISAHTEDLKTPAYLDKMAGKGLRFLEKSLPVLKARPDLVIESVDGRRGGMVLRILQHTQDILSRESDEGERPVVVVKNGKLADVFAPYLPQGKPEKKIPLSQELEETPRERAVRQGKSRATRAAKPAPVFEKIVG